MQRCSLGTLSSCVSAAPSLSVGCPMLRGMCGVVCVEELNSKKDVFSHQWDEDGTCKRAFLCIWVKAELSSEE